MDITLVEFAIISQFDESTGELEYLGIKKTFETLRNFVVSNSLATPISIAIHGEWGSGKTNLLRALEKNLDGTKCHVLFFEAWKYESGDPRVALIATIAKDLAVASDVGVNLIRSAVDAFIRKNLDMDLNSLVATLRSGFDSTANLSKQLSTGISEKLRNRKLVILIDDLDRCDVENTLAILSMMKLFLDIPNCICIAAVDFHRLEQAWFSKYGIMKEDVNNPYRKEGRQYLEKIFQVRVPIPHPNYDERKAFLEKLVPNIPIHLLELLAKIGPVNPRGIKRMINLASYRTFLIDGQSVSITALLWTLFEEILSPEKACRVYEILEPLRGFVIEIFKNPDTLENMHTHLNGEPETIFIKKHSQGRFELFFESAKVIFANTGGSVGEWKPLFDKLYQASKELQS